ncbi:hypothetical protein OG308_07940 [Nocardia salmonicida]|uniref:Uncharacterized protein n=1 Tax=Nocardia salmonicida TaxID=53431 RepID=A0ABZ1ND30_9NOCA
MTPNDDVFSQNPISQLARFSHVDSPAALVSEGAPREQSWCLIEVEDGWWDVFYYERGARTTKLGRAKTRLAALRLLGGRLLYTDILNRATG